MEVDSEEECISFVNNWIKEWRETCDSRVKIKEKKLPIKLLGKQALFDMVVEGLIIDNNVDKLKQSKFKILPVKKLEALAYELENIIDNHTNTFDSLKLLDMVAIKYHLKMEGL